MPQLVAAMAANRMRTRVGEEPPDAAAPAPPEEPSYIAELEHCAQLRDQEVISSEGFEAKKTQL
jgi:hypothetical protein